MRIKKRKKVGEIEMKASGGYLEGSKKLSRCIEAREARRHVYSRHPRRDSISTRMSNLIGQLDEIIDASRPFDYPLFFISTPVSSKSCSFPITLYRNFKSLPRYF